MRHIFKYILSISLVGISFACKDQLDIENPNQPVVGQATTESGILSLAQGGVYVNGFKELKYYDGVPGYFWTGAMGFHELMGDVIGEEAANIYGNQIGCPEYVIFDDGTKVLNPNAPNKQIALIRQININANAQQNTLFYEWAYMYSMNNSCNAVLEFLETIPFTGDADIKKSTIQAWAYWWKGFAYSRIGSTYYAGLIKSSSKISTPSAPANGKYVTKEEIIAESNANFDKAAALLTAMSDNDTYRFVMGKLIPSFNQVGKGAVPSPAMWVRNINTMKARNILVNTPSATMTPAQWNEILTLTSNGVAESDMVFTGRSNSNGDFISATSGAIAPKATGGPADGITYKISERLIQEFKTGDKRLANNFNQLAAPWTGETSRGNAFNTRFALLDGGKDMSGVIVMSSRSVGEYELYLASTHEENLLMSAEAKINTSDIEGGLALIDEIRTLQGAGIADVAGMGLTLDEAKEELRRERRVVMAFRGLSFYDARRWGVIKDVAVGGGRTKAVAVNAKGVVSTNATINYNYLDYWDVPDNELVYNPPAEGSAPVKNPQGL
ncbi:RagB/SusD family nutrient uptake outer membrane protein [Chryseolinea lacunae]|uniref:RagB/SusD family nutrient uptake outer membrane protein n=1 Tax=Chryseolinea lacunae TaxID=2801331 RepID=A0ABS1KVJ0_9BACT|nr:RagB/SusD family nutrient uptake outer membrane protein [Chryseolinea lacunae]MBL0743360.1 RagB/SusD family nutrient uptake outer membrane protein [Chryseolinea lacunae]